MLTKMVVCQKLFQCLKFLVILIILSSRLAFTHSTATKIGIRCIKKEREALLKFKDELIDDYGSLSSWGSEKVKEDCCNWDRTRCDNVTNHIVKLDLQNARLRGNISVSLLDIQHLKYLDLSVNDFSGSRIPQFTGSLSRLQYLDLSLSHLSGEIPRHLGNLSELQILALGTYHYRDWGLFTSANLDWLSGLHSLRYLDLTSVNLSMANNWLQTINNLIQLQELRLGGCDLPMVLPPPRFMFNSSISLHVLDLSGNELTSSWIFPLLFNSNLSYLSELNLRNNKLPGPIPDALGNLSRLESLDLSNNNLTWTITESHFFNISQLIRLDLSSNPGILFNFSLGWNPPFQLAILDLSGCKVGPLFPSWLRTQKELSTLYIDNASISDTFPDWFFELSPKVNYLVASDNNFHGALPNSFSKLSRFIRVDFSNNHFNGSLPTVSCNGDILDLSNNKFSGSITKLCNGTDLMVLDLSNNLLSGQLPNCLANLRALRYLNLAHNNFCGEIPSLNSGGLCSLLLRNNRFTGEIPSSLKNASLDFIDLSHNKLTGKIPTWVGDSWYNLLFLSLKSNDFFGSLPSNLCRLAHLKVLDLSSNKISGGIPTCLNNFTAMSTSQEDFDLDRSALTLIGTGIEDLAFLIWKGIEQQYKRRNLKLMKLIDLSSNNLEGDVPIEITSLVALVGLNLSRNNLSGTIPSKIGELRSLDFLDLSRNHFTGDIPTGISQMDQLGVLDLSYNDLSGKIPQSNHMQTFNDSSFEGNNGLCGLPLQKTCPGDEIVHGPKNGDNADGKKSQEDDAKFIDYGLYISVALGFIVGFWGVCGTLVLNNSWRIAVFKFPNKVMDWCYVRIAVSKVRLGEAFQKFVKF